MRRDGRRFAEESSKLMFICHSTINTNQPWTGVEMINVFLQFVEGPGRSRYFPPILALSKFITKTPPMFSSYSGAHKVARNASLAWS